MINNKYYIGRHSTNNLNDKYMGSGKGIKNAILKYGIQNFKKEFLATTNNIIDLWKLESFFVNQKVVDDKMSYNTALGGKNWLYELQKNNTQKFKDHQSMAGKKGAVETKSYRTKEWHKKGGIVSRFQINELFKYKVITPSQVEYLLTGNTLKSFIKENGLSVWTLQKYSKLGTKIPRGRCKGYTIIQISNPGHYDNVKNDTKKVAAQQRKKTQCPFCEKNNLDGGNFKRHLFSKHNYNQDMYDNYFKNIMMEETTFKVMGVIRPTKTKNHPSEPVVNTGDDIPSQYSSVSITIGEHESTLSFMQARALWTKLGQVLKELNPDDFKLE